MLSVAALVIYVHHIGRSLRVSALIELVGNDTRALIDRVYPAQSGAASAAVSNNTLAARTSGVLTDIDHAELVEQARRADCRLDLLVAMGEFICAGAPLLRVEGSMARLDQDRVYASLILRLERTLDNDVGYGLRLLVDIAERSLADSPFQDPSTTVQAIDRVHDILRQLVHRPFPEGRHCDAEGHLRLTEPTMNWDSYVHLAFDEIRMAGARSPQVTRRVKAALEDLREIAPEDRRAPLDEQLDRLKAAIEASVGDPRDVALLLDGDRGGVGAEAGSLVSPMSAHSNARQ